MKIVKGLSQPESFPDLNMEGLIFENSDWLSETKTSVQSLVPVSALRRLQGEEPVGQPRSRALIVRAATAAAAAAAAAPHRHNQAKDITNGLN
ncbi:hypothetical protein EYF80_038502 [Liparis tanakae]|uniref:Uncharacterized protein n=1 Tax=Liparis tanakae TaxID=230148 RepID=A0A4Z2GEZ4_9TELE|nr:hypothetical protein EYF80_038502 [Liparis tanakae]